MTGVEMRTRATYQPYAECVQDGCSWDLPPSATARDAAKAHVRASGHKVRVVVETVSLWGPR